MSIVFCRRMFFRSTSAPYFLIVLAGLFLHQDSNAAGPGIEFAFTAGGSGSEKLFDLAIDSSGNIYTTGQFSGTVDFDPGSGTAILNSAGSKDIFVQKIDSEGNHVWTKGVGGTETEYDCVIAVDSQGNVLLTGPLLGTVDFDPGSGTHYLASAGSYDAFICKLDPMGELLRAKSVGSTQSDRASSIAIDEADNVYVTGYFNGTVDFDPGVDTFPLTGPPPDFGFILKLDSDGNFVWAKETGGYPWDISLDISGNIYTTGYFGSSVDFALGVDVSILTSLGYRDVFIQKLDPDGNLVWVKDIGGDSGESEGYSVIVDPFGNIYTTGYYWGTTDFDPGAAVFNLSSAREVDPIGWTRFVIC